MGRGMIPNRDTTKGDTGSHTGHLQDLALGRSWPRTVVDGGRETEKGYPSRQDPATSSVPVIQGHGTTHPVLLGILVPIQ